MTLSLLNRSNFKFQKHKNPIFLEYESGATWGRCLGFYIFKSDYKLSYATSTFSLHYTWLFPISQEIKSVTH